MLYLRKVIPVLLFSGSLFFLTPVAADAFSAHVAVEADSLAVGEMTGLSITVTGARPANPPEVEQVDGLQIRSLGASQQYQIINGQFSATVTYTYSVLALNPGEYTLGPYKLRAKKEEVLTNTVNLTVVPDAGRSSITGSDGEQETTGESEKQITSDSAVSKENLFLEITLPKTRLYAGEKLPVAISLLIGGIPVQEVNYPVLNQSEFLFTQSGRPVEKRKVINGLAYQVVEFPAALTAVKTGRFPLGPVELTCTVLARRQAPDPFNDFFRGFFDDYVKQPVTLKSNTWELEVLPLPRSGRPADFNGGVGQFQLEVSASPLEVQVGDPVTVTLTVTGAGNLSSVSAPSLDTTEGFKVYNAQKKPSGEKTGREEQAVFEQVLIPLNQEADRIGPYRFSYFDPEAAEYKTVSSATVPLAVKPNPDFISTPVFTAYGEEPSYGRDLVFIKETPGLLRLKEEVIYRQTWFWLVQLIPVLTLLGAVYYRRRAVMLNSTTPKARARRAAVQAGRKLKKAEDLLAKGEGERFLDELHATVRGYLGERFELPAAGMTGEVVEQLKAEMLSAETLQNIKDFFTLYDFYRFTGGELTAEAIQKLRTLVKDILAGARN